MRRYLGLLRRQIRMRLFWTPAERRHFLVGPQNLWQQKRSFQIEFLTDHGLQPHHRLLDLGCGTLRGGVPIIELLDVGHYTGFEPRAEVLEEGRKELSESGLQHKEPILLCAERVSEAGISADFDFIWAFAVLFHLTDEYLEDTLGFAATRLAAGGAFYANVNIGDQAEGSWQGFPFVSRSLDFYREAAGRHGLQITDLGTLAELGHVSGVAPQDAQRMLEFRAVG